MCFNQEMSFGFAALGFFLSYYVHSRTHNTRLAIGVFWFFVMEFLQGMQYFVIDDCDNWWNKAMTLFGYFHICFQPFFCHLINSALTKSPKYLTQYDFLLKLCVVGGLWLFGRHFIAEFSTSTPITSDFTEWAGIEAPANAYRTTEWLRGEKLCTFSGRYHLSWSVPMGDVSYWSPAASIHSFLMFAPFFIMKKNMIVQGIFLWAAGPLLASYITDNLQEQASIWCFFSIGQIGIMLFLIRDVLILHWGRSSKDASDRSIYFKGEEKKKKKSSKKSN